MARNIGIIDYRMGNLRSVQKALEAVGAEACILDRADRAASVDQLILPGVGAYADGMTHLREGGWPEAIEAFLQSGKPMLGICLGMQLLFAGSEEDAPSLDHPVPGLGVLAGEVERFLCDRTEPHLKVPHMGWNTLRWERDDPLFAGLEQDAAVYFVHSYYVIPAPRGGGDMDETIRSAVCDYAGPFCASIWKDNLWATQFHPEKSQRVGLKMLENFSKVNV